MTSLQKLTEEEVLLVEIRNNIKAQVLCGSHYDKLLRKFSFFQRNCSDPYKIHKKKVMCRLSKITMTKNYLNVWKMTFETIAIEILPLSRSF